MQARPILQIRIARPVSDLTRSVEMYRAGLGLMLLGEFRDHDGFDGAMLGLPDATVHLEFTHCRTQTIVPSPTVEDLLVFYVPDPAAWRALCDAMLAAGFTEVTSFNPYWKVAGRSFEDPDGYRVVLQQGAWTLK